MRQREAATREILAVMSQNKSNAEPVFEKILERAAALCQAPHALLLMRDEANTHLKLVASNSAQSVFVERIRDEPHDLANSNSFAVRVLNDCVSLNLPDLQDVDDIVDAAPQLRAASEVEAMRTVMIVPLLHEDRAIGTICLYKLEVSPFSDDAVRLVETFAAQAVIAIDNVRQFNELQTRLEREAATREILEVISRSRDDEQPVFNAILESASRLIGSPFAGLHMLDDASDLVRLVAQLGLREETMAAHDFSSPLDEPVVVARAVKECAVMRVTDLRAGELYTQRHPLRIAMADVEGARTALVVPLISSGRGIGSMWVFRREVRPYDDDEISLLQSFAAQAVIAIENVRQFKALEARTEEVQALNSSLEARVEDQVNEIERMGRLKRFLSPAVADAVVTSGDEKLLSSHRALIATLFCDIRGFTAFCETAEPEETIEVLQVYHEAMGELISVHGGGVDKRMGDGIMVIFNDPLPCEDPAGVSVRLAIAMQEKMVGLCKKWKRHGHRLGFGVGISLGYATIGMVGSEGRYDYTASGTSVNLAARLCDKAEDGEILLSPRAFTAVEDNFHATSNGEVNLKGIREPVEVFKLMYESRESETD